MGLRENRYSPVVTSRRVGSAGDKVPRPSTANRMMHMNRISRPVRKSSIPV